MSTIMRAVAAGIAALLVLTVLHGAFADDPPPPASHIAGWEPVDPNCPDPNDPNCPDPDDPNYPDPNDPECPVFSDDDDDNEGGFGSDPCGSKSDAGDGLFVNILTGDVWTTVPLFRAFAGGQVDMEFVLRYDSLRANEDGPLGPGWTHTYNRRLVRLTNPCRYVYYDQTGRANLIEHSSVPMDPNGPRDYYTRPGRDFVLEPVEDPNEPCGLTQGDEIDIVHFNGQRERYDGQGRLQQITDRRGRITRLTYDANGRLERIVSGHGREATIEYGENGKIDRIVHPDDTDTDFAYGEESGKFRLTTITDAHSKSLQYTYDAEHRMEQEKLQNETLEYSYSVTYGSESGSELREIRRLTENGPVLIGRASCASGFPTTQGRSNPAGEVLYEDGRGNIWQYARDAFGRVTSVLSPEGHTRRFVWGGLVVYEQSGTSGGPYWVFYGPNTNRLIKRVNERGYEEQYRYDWFGNPVKLIDRAGNVERREYGLAAFPTLMTERTEPDDDVWTYEYTEDGDLERIIDPLVESPEDATISYAYVTYDPNDPNGVVCSDDPLPGRVKKITQTDRNGQRTVFEYSGSGDLVKKTRAFEVLDLITHYESDALGRRVSETVERGEDDETIATWTYDELGRLTEKCVDSTGLALTTVYDYDEVGNLRWITDPRGYQTEFKYDARNRLEYHIEDAGQQGLQLTTHWQRDGNGNIEHETDPLNRTTDFAYNDQDDLTQISDALGYVTDLTPDEAGNTTLIERELTPNDPNTLVYRVELAYDELDRMTTQIVDPGGQDHLNLTTSFTYSTSGGGCSCATPGAPLPHTVIDPKGKKTVYQYDDLDRLTDVIRKIGDDSDEADPNDAVTHYEYDPAGNGNLTALVYPEQERIEFEYDEAGRRELVRGIEETHGNVVISYGFDGADNITQITQPSGNVITLGYDGANRLHTVTDSLGAVVTLNYDDNGNLTERISPNNGTWRYVYDTLNRLEKIYDPVVESPTDAFTQYVYDEVGNRTRTIDNKGVVTKYEYDGLDRLTHMIEDYQEQQPQGDTANTSTTYGYNSLRQIWLKDHDQNETKYRYDAALRLVRATYPDDNGLGSGVVTYGYDEANNLTSRTDQRNITTTYTYDDLHQLATRSYNGSPNRSETFQIDRSGRLRVAENGVARIERTYDGLDRLDTTTQQYLPNGPTYETSFDYSINVGDVQRTTIYPGDREVTHTYDARFRLADVDGGEFIGSTFTYDLSNRRTGMARRNGVNSILEYDLNDRLTRVRHARDVDGVLQDVFNMQHGYDANGNRLYSKQNIAALASRSEVYSYDRRNRLRGMDRGTLSGDPPAVQTPIADNDLAAAQDWTTLDRRGNWGQFDYTIGATPQSVSETRTPNAVNEYEQVDPDGPNGSGAPGWPAGAVDAETLQNDLAGNLYVDPTAACPGDPAGGPPSGQMYLYDEESRLREVQKATTGDPLLTIEYDALGRRVRSTDSTTELTTYHVYGQGLEVVEELSCAAGSQNCTPTLAREFVYGRDFLEPVTMIDWTAAGQKPAGVAEILHYLQDALGSIVALTNPAAQEVFPASPGRVVERYTYDPYGRTLIEKCNQSTGLPVERLAASRFGNPFAWTGQRYDAGVKLYHFLHRSYSPRLGRWLQRDPLGYVDGVSLYEYVASRPTGRRDILGLCSMFALQSATVPPAVGAQIAATIALAITALMAAIESTDPDAIRAAVAELEKALTDAAEILTGFAADAALEAKILAANSTLAAAKILLKMMVDRAGKDIDLPSWANDFIGWAKQNCSGLTPVECVKKYMDRLGITKTSKYWKDYFTDLVKTLSRNPGKWRKK